MTVGTWARWRRVVDAAPVRLAAAVLACALVVGLAWPRRTSEAAPRTWIDLIAPLAPGHEIARDYVLGTIRRGEEHDLVLVARRAPSADRDGASVELHIVDRGQWQGVLETRSFGVAFEAPRSTAPVRDSDMVCRALEVALRANDPGGLGPVDAIPIDPSSAKAAVPFATRALWRVVGPRGLLIGLGLVAVTWLLASLRRGRLWASAWLGAVGLLLRLPKLGLPFDRDQDVQRLFTGHLPVSEILTGAGIQDRHPPLYFLILHAAEWFGQSEWVARAPAAFAGAMVGPAVVVGAWVARRRAGPAVALVALAVTLSVELVRRSRECSEMPLFGLIVVAASASLVRAFAEPSAKWRGAVAATHALALWTYYLAPLVIVGNLASAWALGLRDRRVLRAAGLGVVLGAPSVVLEGLTIARDSGARAAADAHPLLAWGQHGVAEMARELSQVATEALSMPMLAALGAVAALGLARRSPAVLVPLAALGLTFVGIAVVAPVARVQAYYLDAVLPLAALAMAAGLPRGRWALPCGVAIGAVIVLVVVPRSRQAESLYVPATEAVMPELAEIIARRPEKRVLVTVDYDTTILAYYLARDRGLPMDWDGLAHEGATIRLRGLEQTLVPLVRVHTPGDDPEGAAISRVEEETNRGDVLVVARQGLGLQRLDARLSRCDRLLRAGSEELAHCPARSP